MNHTNLIKQAGETMIKIFLTAIFAAFALSAILLSSLTYAQSATPTKTPTGAPKTGLGWGQ